MHEITVHSSSTVPLWILETEALQLHNNWNSVSNVSRVEEWNERKAKRIYSMIPLVNWEFLRDLSSSCRIPPHILFPLLAKLSIINLSHQHPER